MPLEDIHFTGLSWISPRDGSLIFTNQINYILDPCQCGHTEMPANFKRDFRNTTTAIFVNTKSDYKSSPTLKGLIAVDLPLTFALMLFSGSISDEEITNQSGLLDIKNMVEKGDVVMVDNGFNIKEEIETLGLELIIPPTASSGGQMPAADIAKTKTKLPHTECGLKRKRIRFKILAFRLDLSHFANIDQIWLFVAF
ncbi:hypothetical protein KUTeg_022308 [Tegillarca granosa]|uniref:DDE Tnp4 domain-containing protein n=1 Tax=Tegillarca granosa TaxID=220873 RepID=A0ABQ9E613_TEGGR|nr:hypothetical protein KUTeg_022308 [Tegillarca granosa]